MTTVNQSNLCSICNKASAKYCCSGCKKHFCPKHFKEHERQLSMKFDDEIVRKHDELLHEIEKSNSLPSGLFDQIEQWKKSTINNVEKAAERAHHQLLELIDKQKSTITKQLEPITEEIHYLREEENFLENDIDRLKEKLQQFIQKDTSKIIIVETDQIDWNRIISIQEEQPKSSSLHSVNLYPNTKWTQNGVTVAGGNGYGSALNQFYNIWGLCVDDDQNVYAADYLNNHIVEWKRGSTTGRVVASGSGHEVRRYGVEDTEGTVVAGGNGQGNRLDQLNHPRYVCVDQDRSVYVSDSDNYRVMKWMKDEKEGIVVASGQGQGNSLSQKTGPFGIAVDKSDAVYVADSGNHRIIRLREGATEGDVIIGGNGEGNESNQLSCPTGLSFDREGNLYVNDNGNYRVQKFNIDRSE
ncbi:unnamed protein product [Rotaria sp. Silwood2]|nr:unnamed protein product [Rotaria sp. Silwood2]CAF3265495.1 unnamed protein product [Rotaria sp. Silwood2]CAF4043560.1 unnamed protein product [Rotaria sp. Silwood2]CAF4109069.1 unnamed protein product [Rotaria sp. Silwood2]CAF4359880.1 unnamed protein product [Rotaria sp. Silwood2]